MATRGAKSPTETAEERARSLLGDIKNKIEMRR
jgi:hypothetical protein